MIKYNMVHINKDNENNAPYFLLRSFDGRRHMQRVCQQDQIKHSAFHHCREDVIALVKELLHNVKTKL